MQDNTKFKGKKTVIQSEAPYRFPQTGPEQR